jgi:hypothetical protein
MSTRLRLPDRLNCIIVSVIIGIFPAAGLIALFADAIPAYMNSKALVDHGRPIQARIDAIYDRRRGSSRNSVYDSRGSGRYAVYHFTVDGKTYKGEADFNAGYGYRGPIDAVYLPENPSFSAFNPEDKLLNRKLWVGFLVAWNLLFGVAGVLVWRIRCK